MLAKNWWAKQRMHKIKWEKLKRNHKKRPYTDTKTHTNTRIAMNIEWVLWKWYHWEYADSFCIDFVRNKGKQTVTGSMLLLLISNFYAFLTFYFGDAIRFSIFMWMHVFFYDIIFKCIVPWTFADRVSDYFCWFVCKYPWQHQAIIHYSWQYTENQQEKNKMRPDYIPDFFIFVSIANKQDGIARKVKTTWEQLKQRQIESCNKQ